MYTVAIIIVFWAVSIPPAWITLSKIGLEEERAEGGEGGSSMIEKEKEKEEL